MNQHQVKLRLSATKEAQLNDWLGRSNNNLQLLVGLMLWFAAMLMSVPGWV